MSAFQGEEEYEFGEADHSIVYAPNSTGKTSTIDLVRWLLLGEDAAGELKSLHIRGLVNTEVARATRSGSVEADFDVEGRGQFRVRREVKVGQLETKLTVERLDGRGEAIEQPQAFLLRFFPRERIGFNLLTGEHITAFTRELQEDAVKSSVEKLLRFPELASAHRALAAVADSLERVEDQERAANKSARAAADQAKSLEKQVGEIDAKIQAADARKSEWAAKLAEVNRQIGAAEGGAKLQADLDRLADSINAQEESRRREWERISVELSDSWRLLARQAATEEAQAIVAAEERYQVSHSAWSARQGEAKIYREIVQQAECVCTRPVDEELRSRLRSRIEDLEAERPVPPSTPPVPPRTLRSWISSDGTGPFLERLSTAYRHYGEICDDIARLEETRETLTTSSATGNRNVLRELQGQQRTFQIKLRGEESEIARLTENKAKLRAEIATARKKAERKASTSSVAPLAEIAASYARAFNELVEGSIPYYRTKMQERVQEIFRLLYQKNETAEIEFQDGSYLPRIRMFERGQQPSPGEKVRLGIALLLAFRDVASERPFLFLDAPFSELDDEGQDRLLRLLAAQDSQIIIFTKNRFPPEPFAMVKSMRPSVHELRWEQAGKSGRTRILKSDVANLLRRDAK